MAVRCALLFGLFAAAACGQDPFLQPPAPRPPTTDYFNEQAWKHAFQDFFARSKTRPVFHMIEESRPDVCAGRLLEVPLPQNVESWTPQFIPPADGYATVKAQIPAPSCPKG